MNPPENWPDEWKGKTVMDFGTSGRMTCAIVTTSMPTQFHIQNFREIQRRWSIVWPAAREQIERMLHQFGRPTEIKSPLFDMEISIPEEPIQTNVSWSISAHINDGYGGWWNCEFDGWAVDPDASQPYF